MYPRGELAELAARKAALRRELAAARGNCVAAAARLARPVAWLDRALEAGRRFAPFGPLAARGLAGWAGRWIDGRGARVGAVWRAACGWFGR